MGYPAAGKRIQPNEPGSNPGADTSSFIFAYDSAYTRSTPRSSQNASKRALFLCDVRLLETSRGWGWHLLAIVAPCVAASGILLTLFAKPVQQFAVSRAIGFLIDFRSFHHKPHTTPCPQYYGRTILQAIILEDGQPTVIRKLPTEL